MNTIRKAAGAALVVNAALTVAWFFFGWRSPLYDPTICGLVTLALWHVARTAMDAQPKMVTARHGRR
jgi:hypothetical protein